MLLEKVREGIDRNEGVLEDLYIYKYIFTLEKKKKLLQAKLLQGTWNAI